VERLALVPLMTTRNTRLEGVSEFYGLIMRYALLANKTDLFAFCALKTLRKDLKNGLSPSSAHALATYGTVAAALKKYDEAYALGQAARAMQSRLNVKETYIAMDTVVSSFLVHIRQPMADVRIPFKELYKMGVQNGDFFFALAAANGNAEAAALAGRPLSEVEDILRSANQFRVDFDAHCNTSYSLPFYQHILRLRGKHKERAELSGEGVSENDEDSDDDLLVFSIHSNKFKLAVWFMKWELALDILDNKMKISPWGGRYKDQHFSFTQFAVFSCLCYLKCYEKTHDKGLYRKAMKEIQYMEEKFSSGFVVYGPLIELVRAVKVSIVEEDTGAVEAAFVKATNVLEDEGLINYAALAFEIAGLTFVIKFRDYVRSERYLSRSLDLYEEWQAHAKVTDVDRKYDAVFSLKMPE